jgi:hypothetical protein
MPNEMLKIEFWNSVQSHITDLSTNLTSHYYLLKYLSQNKYKNIIEYIQILLVNGYEAQNVSASEVRPRRADNFERTHQHLKTALIYLDPRSNRR